MIRGTKEYLFFLLVMIVSYIAGILPYLASPQIPVWVTLIFTTILGALYLGIIYNARCYKSSCNSVNSDKEDFLFELTPAKICDGGSYMSSTGWRKKFCDEFMSTEKGQKEYTMYNCGAGTKGRPLNNLKDFPNISGPNFTNEACDDNNLKLKPL